MLERVILAYARIQILSPSGHIYKYGQLFFAEANVKRLKATGSEKIN